AGRGAACRRNPRRRAVSRGGRYPALGRDPRRTRAESHAPSGRRGASGRAHGVLAARGHAGRADPPARGRDPVIRSKVPVNERESSTEGVARMVTMTDTAAKKVSDLRLEEGKPEWGLRIRVVGGGCSGMSYELGWEDQETSGDNVIEAAHGIKVYIDPQSA